MRTETQRANAAELVWSDALRFDAASGATTPVVDGDSTPVVDGDSQVGNAHRNAARQPVGWRSYYVAAGKVSRQWPRTCTRMKP